MNLTLKRIICLFLILAMIVPFIDNQTSYAANSSLTVYDESKDYFTSATKNGQTWEAFKTYYGVPLDLPYKSDNGWFFNIEIWMDQQIAVYGDHSSISNNDFKNATLKNYTGDLTGGNKNQGYYKSSGLLGEFRYHGFDSKGNKYVNLDFPADSDSGRKPENKKWIYRIWDLESSYYKSTRIKEGSQYYQAAKLSDSNAADIRSWIAETLPFKITNSTDANKEAYNYAHVLTAPTTRFPGQALMYHQADIVYYQMFSLNKRVQDKSKFELVPYIAVNKTGEGVSSTNEIDLSYEVKLTGKYRDNELWSPYTVYNGVPVEVARTIYYTRDEIKSWTIKLQDTVTNETTTISNIKPNGNAGSNTFNVKIPYSKYKSKLKSTETGKTLDIAFNGTITLYFYNGDSITQTISSLDSQSAPDPVIDEDGTKETTPTKPLVKKVKLDISAPKYMLDTETFKVLDNTELPVDASRKVILEGVELFEADSENFIAGQYLFPLIGKDKIYSYSIVYTDGEGTDVKYSSYIVVYTTKPKAQFKTIGTFKENRKITVNTDFESVNSTYLLNNVSINNLVFNATSGLSGSLKFKTKDANQMVLLVKDESELDIKIKVESVVPPNLIERSDIPNGYFISDDYNQTYHIDEDYVPAIIANIWSGVMIRGETLDFTYDGSSYDDDLISINKYVIYYDANGDGEPEQIVKQGLWDSYDSYTPSKLGTYKIVFHVEESFGQETISEFITASDKRTATAERVFYVDNVAPVIAIETNIDVNIPKVDVLVLNDQGITRALNDEIKTKRVDWINNLGQTKGVSANLQIWDLFTYIDTKHVTPSQNTGATYPATTWTYSSGGYTGVLDRINVRDNGSYYDFGYSQEYTTCVDEPIMKWVMSGSQCGWLETDTGTVALACWVQTGTKTVCTTSYEWVSDYRWVSNYYGDYQGSISKATKQTFDPILSIDSEKYIVYFAKDNINNKTDLEAMLKKASGKVILVGNPSLKNTISHYAFVDANQPLSDIMTQVNDIIGNDSALDNKKLLLIGETFQTYFMDFDEEQDTLTNIGIQYVQETNYYDNSMGLESNALTFFSDSGFKAQTVITSFNKTGKYTVYRKIRDTIPNYTGFQKNSNIAQLEIYVHRKPIADFELSWTYDQNTNQYLTNWVDLSYDLDHEFSDPDKGIRDRKIMYRKTNGDNVWHYAIPERLTSGSYELKYIVKDIEGAWSDEKVKTFVLADAPPIQIWAKLKPQDAKFSIHAIPASEGITIYDIETNYHKPHGLSITLTDAFGNPVKPIALNLNSENPLNTKRYNLYNWQNVNDTLAKTLPDGLYYIELKAVDTSNSARFSTIRLPFNIVTPITVKGSLEPMITGLDSTALAVTNKYAETVSVTLFKGTPYEKTLNMQKDKVDHVTGETSWKLQFTVPNALPEGDYSFEFTASTASGKTAKDLLTREVLALNISSVEVTGYWQHWRGQIDLFGKRLSYMPHRFLSYEKIKITAEISGNPDSVTLRLSPELEAMAYTNKYGQTYYYRDEIGYEPEFPLAFSKISGNEQFSVWEATYILPLAGETMDVDDNRLKAPYFIEVIARRGNKEVRSVVNDIDLTGNVYDMIYHQPKYGE